MYGKLLPSPPPSTPHPLTAANDSTCVSGQDRKISPALGTNQIAGFGGFYPPASLEKINNYILIKDVHFKAPCTCILKYVEMARN